MKKIVTKTLMVLGIATLGIFVGSMMAPSFAHAQFAADSSSANSMGLSWGNSTNLVDLVKGFVNWILRLVWLVALLMALYGGFQMVTSAGDDTKYKAGYKVLKNAAIGLIIIGLSWILVSSVFWIIGTVWGQAKTATAATTTP